MPVTQNATRAILRCAASSPSAPPVPEIGKPVRAGYKALVPSLDSAVTNWQAFARNLLTHRNPYNGLTWAQDPILIGICPLNEDA